MKKPTTKYGKAMWKARCDMIFHMDNFIGWEDDEDDMVAWLMVGPPDGICEEYGEVKNTYGEWEETELADFVLEDSTFKEWVECFGRRFNHIKEDFDIEEIETNF